MGWSTKTQEMRCTTCNAKKRWTSWNFPVRIEATCYPCGQERYGWPDRQNNHLDQEKER